MTNNNNLSISSNKNNNSDDDSFVEVMEVDATPAALLHKEPKPALKVKLTPKHDVIGVENKVGTTQVCATISATELPDDDQRAPVDIIVALDVSGSMHGKKLELCKTTLELLIRNLHSHDRFGLVTFADEAIVEIPTTKLTDSFKNDALLKVKGLRTRGCTNISGAIGLAAQEMLSITEPNDVRSIFLLTDGLANRGVTTSSGIIDIAKGCLAPQEGKDDGTAPITIHCFGYGTDHDDSLLTDVSEATTGGTYYFVQNDDNIATAFGDLLGGLLSVVAQNATITIRPASGSSDVSIINVHDEKKMKNQDGSYTVNLGDFYAEESRDVLVDITLSNGQISVVIGAGGAGGATMDTTTTTSSSSSSMPIPHVEVSLSYMDTIQKKLVTNYVTVCTIKRPTGTELSIANDHVTVQWLRVHTANEIKKADDMSRLGNLTQARSIINACIDVITKEASTNTSSSSLLSSHPLIQQLIKDLNDVLKSLESHSSYATYGTRLCKMKRQGHTRQRCSAPTTEESNYYRSTMKRSMQMKFLSSNNNNK